MSESLNRLKLVKVSDNRINDEEVRSYALLQGGSLYTRRRLDATSISASTLSFNNVNPPTANTYLDKRILLTIVYSVAFVGTTTGTNLLDEWGSQIAPRCMPVNNSFSSVSLQLNNATFNQDQNDVLPAFTRVGFKKLKRSLSMSPNALDQSQQYSECIGTRNPLGPVNNAEPDEDVARGGFQGVVFGSNTPTAGSLLLTCTEPVMVSPLDWNNSNEPAFVGLTNFTFNGVFDANLQNRVISVMNGSVATFSSIVVTPVQAQMHFLYITPSVISPIPKILNYPYFPINRYVTDNSVPLAPLASTTKVTNNIQISSIPKRIILYVKQNKATITPSSCDVFAAINSISVDFMNRSSLLASASQQQLFEMSKNNMLDMDWNDFSGSLAPAGPSPLNPGSRSVSGPGSMVVINPVFDFGLDNLQTSGSTGQTQLSISVNYTNLNKVDTISFSLYLVIVDDGLITIPSSGGVCYQQNSIVGSNDLLKTSLSAPSFTTGDVLVQDQMGGSFWGKLKSFFSDLAPYAKTALKAAAPLAAGVVPELAPFLPLIQGLGCGGCGGCAECGEVMGRAMAGAGRRKGKAMVGGRQVDYMGEGMDEGMGLVGGRKSRAKGLVGGKQLSRASLKQLLLK